MNRYLIAKWIHTLGGDVPDLPENSGFLCLGGTSRNSLFGLFEVEICDDLVLDEDLIEVSPPLKTLLDSAQAFPPAMAHVIEHMNQFEATTSQTFRDEIERALLQQLDFQKTSRACLLRSRIDEVGYRSRGEFVWVIAYRPNEPNPEVTWVSHDFQTYTDSVGTFDVDPEWLLERFLRELAP